MTPRARILVVDDSDTAREIYGSYLRNAGYEVLEAVDGPSGLERVETDRPDLLILDVLLPGIDGLEVMRRIRKGPNGDLPIICVTASLRGDFRERATDLRCDAFFEKPGPARRIVELVDRLLAEHSADPADASGPRVGLDPTETGAPPPGS